MTIPILPSELSHDLAQPIDHMVQLFGTCLGDLLADPLDG